MTDHPRFKWERDLCARDDIKGMAMLVGLYLATRSDIKGHCYPSIRRIAEDCGIGKNTAHRAIKALEQAGVLWINPGKPSPKGGSANYYTLKRLSPPRGQAVPTAGTPLSPQWVHNRPTNRPEAQAPSSRGPDGPYEDVENLTAEEAMNRILGD